MCRKHWITVRVTGFDFHRCVGTGALVLNAGIGQLGFQNVAGFDQTMNG